MRRSRRPDPRPPLPRTLEPAQLADVTHVRGGASMVEYALLLVAEVPKQ